MNLKILRNLSISAILTNATFLSVNAQTFVGVGAGVGIDSGIVYKGTQSKQPSLQPQNVESSSFDYELLVGYQNSSQPVSFRVYGLGGLSYLSTDPKLINATDISANIDVVYSIPMSADKKFSIYGGAGVGLLLLSGKAIKETNSFDDKIKALSQNSNSNHDYKIKSQNFYTSFAINLGTQFYFNQRNAVELAARIPLSRDKSILAYDDKLTKEKFDITLKVPYTMSLRYIFTF